MTEQLEQLTREEVSKLVRKVKDWNPSQIYPNQINGAIGNLDVMMDYSILTAERRPREINTRVMSGIAILGRYSLDDSDIISIYETVQANYKKAEAEKIEKQKTEGLKEARKLIR